MINELLINGKDAYATYGVRMGDGFLEALNAPASVKDYVENESRLKHGKEYVLRDAKGNSLVRVASRDLALSFVIMGETRADFEEKRNAFYSLLYQGGMEIQVPEDNRSFTYKLVYKGKSTSYSHNLERTCCKVAVKFEEPNPTDRERK